MQQRTYYGVENLVCLKCNAVFKDQLGIMNLNRQCKGVPVMVKDFFTIISGVSGFQPTVELSLSAVRMKHENTRKDKEVS